MKNKTDNHQVHKVEIAGSLKRITSSMHLGELDINGDTQGREGVRESKRRGRGTRNCNRWL